MMMLVPVIHRGQPLFTLADRQHWAFCQDVQIGIGNQRGDFNDAVGIGLQPGHLQVNPDQILRFIHACVLSQYTSRAVYQARKTTAMTACQ